MNLPLYSPSAPPAVGTGVGRVRDDVHSRHRQTIAIARRGGRGQTPTIMKLPAIGSDASSRSSSTSVGSLPPTSARTRRPRNSSHGRPERRLRLAPCRRASCATTRRRSAPNRAVPSTPCLTVAQPSDSSVVLPIAACGDELEIFAVCHEPRREAMRLSHTRWRGDSLSNAKRAVMSISTSPPSRSIHRAAMRTLRAARE